MNATTHGCVVSNVGKLHKDTKNKWDVHKRHSFRNVVNVLGVKLNKEPHSIYVVNNGYGYEHMINLTGTSILRSQFSDMITTVETSEGLVGNLWAPCVPHFN